MIENARPRPVGTSGGVEWMRGPGACPGWGATFVLHGTPTNRRATRTSTRPPPCPTSAPCPYRMGNAQDPIRSSTFIRRGADTLPVLVVNIHQDRGIFQTRMFCNSFAILSQQLMIRLEIRRSGRTGKDVIK